MPVEGVVLQCRPVSCEYCMPLYYATGHVSEEAQRLGVDFHDMIGELDEQAPVLDAAQQFDPLMFTGAGHGSTNAFTSNTERDIITLSNAYLLAGRIVYLLSCSTAAELGPEALRQGVLSYAGYDRDWSWVQDNIEIDPYKDPHGDSFFRSSNEYPISLLNGLNVAQSHQKAYDSYSYWVEYWRTSGDNYSAEMMKWLLWDRDHLVTLGNGMASLYLETETPELSGYFKSPGYTTRYAATEDLGSIWVEWEWEGGLWMADIQIQVYHPDGSYEQIHVDTLGAPKKGMEHVTPFPGIQPGMKAHIYLYDAWGSLKDDAELTLVIAPGVEKPAHWYDWFFKESFDKIPNYVWAGTAGFFALMIVVMARRRGGPAYPYYPMLLPQPQQQPVIVVR